MSDNTRFRNGPLPELGESVRLIHERFLPAQPSGVVTHVEFDGAVTFDEDFGGGSGTYPAHQFVPYLPDALTIADRAVVAAGVELINRPRYSVAVHRLAEQLVQQEAATAAVLDKIAAIANDFGDGVSPECSAFAEAIEAVLNDAPARRSAHPGDPK